MRKPLGSLAANALLALALFAFASACSSETDKGAKKAAQEKRVVFAPIKDCKLVLELVSSRTEFYRGDPEAKVTFRLRNEGLKPVTIYEWFAKEEDNIKLSYARCDDKSTESIPASFWVQCPAQGKPGDPRMPLDLYPRNTALVTVSLSGIKDFSSGSGAKSSYAISGELNLTSASAKSKPFIITFK